jgi:hypothetical protein
MLWRLRFVGGGVRRFDCLNGEHGRREQFAGAGDVLGALAAAVRIAMVIRTSITAKRRSVSETVRRDWVRLYTDQENRSPRRC